MPGIATLGFILRSLRASFRGEKMAHLLTITTVCLSLMLIGVVDIVKDNLASWASSWASQVSVSVFIRSDIEEPARKKLAMTLKDSIKLTDVVWTAPDAAATELADILGIKGANNLDRFAPWIAEGKRTAATNTDALQQLPRNKNILYVDYGTVLAEKLHTIADRITSGGVLIVFFLMLGAFVVVSNTVGLALNARRDEVEIMDLVGTPLEWIYAAYLTEGLLLGVTGAAAAVIVLKLTVHALSGPWIASIGIAELSSISLTGALLLFFLGGVIGVAGSAVSIRRFLAR